ncbi:MAG: ATP-binding protein [Polyangia bacterium]
MGNMRRLYTRLFFHFLSLLFIVGLLTSVVFSIGQRGWFWREVTERMSRHIAGLLGERFDDAALRRHVAERIHKDFALDLAVRDLSGALLTEAGAPLPPLSDAELTAARGGRALVRHSPYSVLAPIRDERSGAMLGLLNISPPTRLHAWSLSGLGRTLFAVAVVLLVVGGVTAPLARRISRPVERLIEASRRLGAGELSYRIPPSPRHPCPDCDGGAGGPYRSWHGRFHEHVHGHIHRHVHGHAPGGIDRWHRRHGRRPPRRLDELTELEVAWNDMAERIERLVRGQKELLANISHELRSPLARVRLALELVPREGEVDTRLREVEADLDELDRLIADVLITSRLEATGLPANPAEIDLTGLLRQITERAARDPLTAQLQPKLVLTDDEPLRVRADAALLKRAVNNLIENAAKYGAAPLTVRAVRDGDAVEIAVSDEGPGIPRAERERVFDPFYRIDKARTPAASSATSPAAGAGASPPGSGPHGFGLGLTLARRVAEAHGGSARITATRTDPATGEERGCCVTLRLPDPG